MICKKPRGWAIPGLYTLLDLLLDLGQYIVRQEVNGLKAVLLAGGGRSGLSAEKLKHRFFGF
jgi:hypothetical protein